MADEENKPDNQNDVPDVAEATPQVAVSGAAYKAIIDRIDAVLKDNSRTEQTYLFLTIILFFLGISCFIVALATREFAWSSPSAITTGLLYWPLREIKDIRAKNIALATTPLPISQLPKNKAAEEIQKLIQRLYGENK
jgi:hypothetical protein